MAKDFLQGFGIELRILGLEDRWEPGKLSAGS